VITAANQSGTYRLWSPSEQTRLDELRRQGVARQQIAAELGRSPKAIKHRLER
jgi:DNA-binding NarL/FixJ family response regulator